jgi:DNA polymerase-3 subunit epsilon
MMWCVFDTETSDLPDFKLPAHEQPARLCHFFALQLDESFEVQREIDLYVQPDGWTIAPEARAINGLTEEFLEKEGQPIGTVLDTYTELVKLGYDLAAFNAQFDAKIMRGELRRLDRPDMFEETRNTCLMRASAPICNMPKNNGHKGFRWPKLAEAYHYFTGKALEDAHSAKADAYAALEVLRALADRGVLPEPKVHYAKQVPGTPAAKQKEMF